MARDLTIHDSADEGRTRDDCWAGKEGLGVGTYLRALALRNAFGSSDTPRGMAFAALRRAQERAKSRGLDRLSAKDIDAEIKAARATRGRRG